MSGKAMDNSALKIGIDLGTSRSAIAASNDQRQWVESYVGWPKDFVKGTVTPIPGHRVWIFRDEEGLYAISAVCPASPSCSFARWRPTASGAATSTGRGT